MAFHPEIEKVVIPNEFRVDGQQVSLPTSVADSARTVALGVLEDLGNIEELPDSFTGVEHVPVAESVASELEEKLDSPMADINGVVSIKYDDLEVVWRAANDLHKAYEARKPQHVERIAEERSGEVSRIRLLGAKALGSIYSFAGRMSGTGRSASYLRRTLTEDTMEQLRAKVSLNRKVKQEKPVAHAPDLDPRTIFMDANQDDQSPEETPYW